MKTALKPISPNQVRTIRRELSEASIAHGGDRATVFLHDGQLYVDCRAARQSAAPREGVIDWQTAQDLLIAIRAGKVWS